MLCREEATTLAMKTTTKIFVLMGLLVMLCITALIAKTALVRPDASLETLEQSNAGLQSQVEEDRKVISSLEERIRELELGPWIADRSPPPSGDSTLGLALVRRVDNLALAQSNMMVLLQSVATQFPELVPPEIRWRESHTNITVLEQQLGEVDLKAEALRQEVEQLAANLQIPTEVRNLSLDVGLADDRLTTYRPYFEAVSKLNQTVIFRQTLYMKIASKRVDAELIAIRLSR